MRFTGFEQLGAIIVKISDWLIIESRWSQIDQLDRCYSFSEKLNASRVF